VLLRLFMSPVAANIVSYFIAAIANTGANRRFTFGVRGSRRAIRHQLEGGVAFLVGLTVSTSGLAIVHAMAPDATWVAEVGALLGFNLFAAVIRFVLLRAWVFHPRRTRPEPSLQEQPR
jgi:putative flippase GtrA